MGSAHLYYSAWCVKVLAHCMTQGPKNVPLLEAAVAVLQGAGGSLPITSLNKALFYFDLRCLRDAGNLATDRPYIALPAGPVVAKYQRKLVAALENEGLAEQDDDGNAKPICLVSLPRFSGISDTELEWAKEVGSWASSRSAKALSDFSHENVGWTIAWERGLGSQKPAQVIDMHIAMQQIIDDDPWLDEPVDRPFSEAVSLADVSSGVPW